MIDLRDVPPPARVIRRIMENSIISENGCYVWRGYTNEAGYGRIAWQSRLGPERQYVHRAMWLGLVGSIPPEYEVDHLCRVRACWNPAHLEPVTRQENGRRALAGIRSAARKRVKAVCKRGHPFAGENLYVVPRTGARCCRECRRVEARERYRRKTGSAGRK